MDSDFTITVIRYILAVVLTVTLLSVAVIAIEHVETERADSDVQTAIAEVEATALELKSDESPPERGQESPRRTVTLSLPADELGSKAVDTFTVQSHTNMSPSRITYQISDSNPEVELLSAPLIVEGSEPLRLDTTASEIKLVLSLEYGGVKGVDSDGPVVVLAEL